MANWYERSVFHRGGKDAVFLGEEKGGLERGRRDLGGSGYTMGR